MERDPRLPVVIAREEWSRPSSQRPAVDGHRRLCASVESLKTRAFAGLLKRRDTLFRDSIEGTSGKILKHTGDGFLAEFSLSSEAVVAAPCLQCLMNEESWEPKPLKLRVGLY